ncbi:hypothetical protein PTW37_04630 [Arthrobacter agilis]|uniref:hypothetical protein n=1 Tax=Arthrobacter agilis TaxID=37921 RepID=UPI0023660A73|nr:hypothetical protein [Arthrobacter agilis]WDF34215.1 hypothetical protein PTW37_04630 [Arthrobacter agilis]
MWLESVVEPGDVLLDRGMGINTYAGLTSNSDLEQVVREGSFAIPGWPASGASGFMLADEVDMWAGAGADDWSGLYPGEGEICSPASAACGFTVLQSLADSAPPGTMLYTNYGKGVTFWHSDADAARFVNEFQDVLSADNYWFTDPFICGPSEGGAVLNGGQPLPAEDCRRARNYGWTVDRVRSLVEPEGSKPVWALVEVGHPFQEESGGSIDGPEIRAAVWSSIINGARGIVYFNHSFGGRCTTQHVLREPCGDAVRPWVEKTNRQITALAPVLNSPFVDGFATSHQEVDIAAKLSDGTFHLLVASTGDGPQRVAIDLACGGSRTAVVDGEGRSIPVRDGVLVDEFDDANSVHLYTLLGGGTCGLDNRS